MADLELDGPNSAISVDTLKPKTGTTLTLGESGDTVTLPSGATFDASNATVEGISGGVDFQTTPKTASFTAVSGEGYYVNTTSSAITVTLPTSPSVGDLVSIVDYAGTSATNNITINPNSNNFLGATDNVVIKENRAALNLIYADATQGWTLTAYAKETDLITAPDAPTIGTATATGSTTATVDFIAPSNDGGSTITSYTATSNPSGITGVLNQAGSGTITVTGLAAETSYTFTVTATNAVGTSDPSAASNSITTPSPSYDIQYLVVAGGGGGGKTVGGGGGAGGFRSGTVPTASGAPITVTVGGGGAGATTSVFSTSGSNSQISGPSITTYTSAGGGFGGNFNDPAPYDGGNGGSGGGGGRSGSSGGTGNTPSVSPPQGNNGGASAPSPWSGGGGGGASAAGVDGQPGATVGGNGGNGSPSTITGSNITYAGGGGGAQGSGGPTPQGGTGGGGNGGHYPSTAATNGTANTGGGGGGDRDSGTQGGDGGSGVVILRMATSDYSGTTTGSPTVTTSGSDTILKYTGSGTYTT